LEKEAKTFIRKVSSDIADPWHDKGARNAKSQSVLSAPIRTEHALDPG
jgi:hypothetical protein